MQNKNNSIRVKHSNGASTLHADMDDVLATLLLMYGTTCYVSDELAWATEADSENDDGARAVARIFG